MPTSSDGIGFSNRMNEKWRQTREHLTYVVAANLPWLLTLLTLCMIRWFRVEVRCVPFGVVLIVPIVLFASGLWAVIAWLIAVLSAPRLPLLAECGMSAILLAVTGMIIGLSIRHARFEGRIADGRAGESLAIGVVWIAFVLCAICQLRIAFHHGDTAALVMGGLQFGLGSAFLLGWAWLWMFDRAANLRNSFRGPPLAREISIEAFFLLWQILVNASLLRTATAINSASSDGQDCERHFSRI